MSAHGSEPGEKQHTPPATPDHFSHGDHETVLPRHLALPTTAASCPTYAQWMSTLFGSVVNYVLAPATEVAVPPVVVPALEEHELGTDEMIPVHPHTQSTPHSSAGSVRIVHDVVILNANPLVASLHNDSRPHHSRTHASISTPVSELPFHVEQKELTRALKSTHAPARLHFHHFSVASLGEQLTKCPTVLSLNGHGFVRDGEFFMALESAHGTGESDLCDMSRLRRLLAGFIRHNNSSTFHANTDLPQLMLLNMCHSEFAAKEFVNAGVEHVIACRGDMRVSDVASRNFSRHFFIALFSGHSIQRAFDIAKSNLNASLDSGFPEALKAHVANKDRLHQQLLQTKQRDADDDAHLVRAASAPAPTITLTKPDDNTMHELRKAGSSSSLLCSHPGTEPSCAECNDRLLFPESVKFLLLPLDVDHEVVLFPNLPQRRHSEVHSLHPPHHSHSHSSGHVHSAHVGHMNHHVSHHAHHHHSLSMPAAIPHGSPSASPGPSQLTPRSYSPALSTPRATTPLPPLHPGGSGSRLGSRPTSPATFSTPAPARTKSVHSPQTPSLMPTVKSASASRTPISTVSLQQYSQAHACNVPPVQLPTTASNTEQSSNSLSQKIRSRSPEPQTAPAARETAIPALQRRRSAETMPRIAEQLSPIKFSNHLVTITVDNKGSMPQPVPSPASRKLILANLMEASSCACRSCSGKASSDEPSDFKPARCIFQQSPTTRDNKLKPGGAHFAFGKLGENSIQKSPLSDVESIGSPLTSPTSTVSPSSVSTLSHFSPPVPSSHARTTQSNNTPGDLYSDHSRTPDSSSNTTIAPGSASLKDLTSEMSDPWAIARQRSASDGNLLSDSKNTHHHLHYAATPSVKLQLMGDEHPLSPAVVPHTGSGHNADFHRFSLHTSLDARLDGGNEHSADEVDDWSPGAESQAQTRASHAPGAQALAVFMVDGAVSTKAVLDDGRLRMEHEELIRQEQVSSGQADDVTPDDVTPDDDHHAVYAEIQPHCADEQCLYVPPDDENSDVSEQQDEPDMEAEFEDMCSHLPFEPEFFVARHVEVQKMIALTQAHRVVNVFGTEPGVGKSGVVVRAAHYLQQRRHSRNVVHVSFRTVHANLPALLRHLTRSLRALFRSAANADEFAVPENSNSSQLSGSELEQQDRNYLAESEAFDVLDEDDLEDLEASGYHLQRPGSQNQLLSAHATEDKKRSIAVLTRALQQWQFAVMQDSRARRRNGDGEEGEPLLILDDIPELVMPNANPTSSAMQLVGRSSAQSVLDTMVRILSSANTASVAGSSILASDPRIRFRCVVVSSFPLQLSANAAQSLFLGILCIGALPESAGIELVHKLAPFVTPTQAKELVIFHRGVPSAIRLELMKILQTVAVMDSAKLSQ